MPSYLMWQYKNRDSGEFHAANTEAARTKMLGKGYVDITNKQVWEVPYPICKKNAAPDPLPAVDIPKPPAETLPAEEVTK